MLALTDMTTARALQRSGESATIKKEDHLLASFQFLFHVRPEPFRKYRRPAFLFSSLATHVDNPNEGQRLTVCSLGQSDEIVFACLGVLERFQGRGCGAQNNLTSLKISTDHRKVSTLVLGWIFLLIGVFVFLVYDDQAGRGKRGKYRRSGSHDYHRLPFSDSVPLVEPFPLR